MLKQSEMMTNPWELTNKNLFIIFLDHQNCHLQQCIPGPFWYFLNLKCVYVWMYIPIKSLGVHKAPSEGFANSHFYKGSVRHPWICSKNNKTCILWCLVQLLIALGTWMTAVWLATIYHYKVVGLAWIHPYGHLCVLNFQGLLMFCVDPHKHMLVTQWS